MQPLTPEIATPSLDLTDDALFQGKLICRQWRHGYRFSLDAVLAAHFADPKSGQRVLDLGCGCGVIGLVLAYRHPSISGCGLELQEELAAVAGDNIARNGFADRLGVIQGDVCAIKDLLAPESFDVVVCNPPYRKRATGRISQGNQAACARHEVNAGVEDFVRAAAFCVKNRGRVVFVYPARRFSKLLFVMQQHRLMPKRLLPVHSYPGQAEAKLVLIESMKNGGEQNELLAPLYIYERKNGGYSPAMLAMYAE